ncbi:glycine oxidase ThiO [Corynebacterium anserum]|uniref:glycine oxidase n=1 Tax=Corynebacterium anserum TaxID=2684406 RepID=A0A7G7YQG7_9CORY|nr:glycine oxidase ThiO [Corynebacterium anserum]MBC2682423.1 glycine oxidase ThiO [Corynebacterium anserum]QNH96737.1 glycine oxidase ThiO [Corynebacterium anserum]
MNITIIGAGAVGLATTVTLAAAGHKVRLVDPAPASGATHHAGGMLAPAAEVVYQQDPLFPLMQAAGQWYPELLDLIAHHTQLPTGHRTDGTLVLAADRADAEHLRNVQDYQAAHGMTVERISTREARTMEPALTPRLAGAVSIPGDHQVFPRQLAAAMLDAARNLGVDIVREQAHSVAGFLKENGGDADRVVLANGLGAAQMSDEFSSALQLRPVYGDILRCAEPEPQQPLVRRVVRGFVEGRPIYIIPRSDGTIAVGATSREDGRQQPRAGEIYGLLRDGIRIVPGIEECDLVEASVGARPGTPDDLPYLGYAGEKIIVSTGYFRHGILLSSLAARVTRELIEGTPVSVDVSACAPERFAGRS